MFEGKRGPRIYKKKEDAEFIWEEKKKNKDSQVKILKIQVSDEKMAEKIGATVHPDLSIAAREPKKGERGWIVVQNFADRDEKYDSAFEILNEYKN